ncbi:MAG TPA: nitronate monooxygenase [Fulvivirga sp.]|nr:nitronate monooxygenase [Fulvivirga sp.]
MNRITRLFNTKYPIVQAGMVWCSGWRLASAVSNAGGLGLIGSGSMHPELLAEHIAKCKQATNKPFGVNVPLLYPEIEKLMDIIVKGKVKIVFTSAGNPKSWTQFLKQKGITVVHVVSSVKFALKSQEAGVDAVVAEGFEAGGHNGREEITTFCLVPAVREAIDIPLIAAGGIGNGRGVMGAFALGAEGVQIGSRFAVSKESSAHDNFKNRIIESEEGETVLTLKQLTPVRLIKNGFYDKILGAERYGATAEELRAILGQKRSKKGIFEGDLEEGELEIGQIAAYINDIKPAGEILNEIWAEYEQLKKSFCQ